MDYSSRLKELERTLIEKDLDGFVVSHPANLRYLCGYAGSNGLLLLLSGRRTFFTDGRYTQQARDEVKGTRVVIAKGPLMNDAAKVLGKVNSAAVGFEADYTTVAAAGQGKLVNRKIRWKPTTGLIMRQRMIKDAEELRAIRNAVGLGADVYHEALKVLRPGARESEVAGRLEYAARQSGAEGMSFETIVAAGPRSALPHGHASTQPIPRHGFVVVDWVLYCGAIVPT